MLYGYQWPHPLVLVKFIADADVALSSKLPGYGAGIGHVAAPFVQRVPNLGYRSVPIVGYDLDKYADAMGRIPFVDYFLEYAAFQLAGSALDSPINVIFGHIGCLSLVDGQPQPDVGREIPSAFSRRYGDLLSQTGEDLAALRVCGCLLVFDCGPF